MVFQMTRLFLHSRLLNPQTGGTKVMENLLPMVRRKKNKKNDILLELYAGTLHTNYLFGPNRLKLMGDSCRRRRRWRFQAGRGPCCQEENGEEATTQTRFFKVRQMAPFNTRKDFVGITCGWRRVGCSPQTDLRQRTSSSAHSVW